MDMALLGAPFLVTSAVAGIAYGLVLQFRPSSAFRTFVKTVAVGVLAVWSFVAGAPALLTAALVFSAIGDAFLAGNPKRWLPPGLASFLLGHLIYVALFLELGGVHVLAAQPVRLIAGAVGLAAGIGLVVWLWKDFGPMRPAVIAYMLAISAMVASAFSLDASRWSAMLGAVAFMASDGILSWRLFKRPNSDEPLADHAVWWLYWTGQVGIATAFLL
jgi:uncharacterized membrane protein YhhN